MTVNTNSSANVGQYSVSIEASFVNSLGATVALPSTTWVLNVQVCLPNFTLASQPESPVVYVVFPVSSTFTTLAAIEFTDSNSCGITPTYRCMISGSACPSWITINASNKITVNTNSPANIGQYSATIEASYVS